MQVVESMKESLAETCLLDLVALVRAFIHSCKDDLDSISVLEEIHQRGHTKHDARDAMPSGATQEDTNQLNRESHFSLCWSGFGLTS